MLTPCNGQGSGPGRDAAHRGASCGLPAAHSSRRPGCGARGPELEHELPLGAPGAGAALGSDARAVGTGGNGGGLPGVYFLEEASVSRSLLSTRPRSWAGAVSTARQGQRAGRRRGPAWPPGDSRPVATTATLKMLRHRRSPCFTFLTFSKTLCEVAGNEAGSQVPLRSEFCATSGVRDPFQPSLIFTFLITISHCHGACYFWKEGTGRWSLNDNKSWFK